ncbi:vomeronasal type-2 receptor 26-like [Anomaloglossus baeobatrachus]|uniref:vomeronasal type-2 receptor 26-like n=1 Tax=Anomaloglossus baeobatrachus TaxID=238106 RepID=UPI003F4FC4B2
MTLGSVLETQRWTRREEKSMKAVVTLILLCMLWVTRAEDKKVMCSLRIGGNRKRYTKDGDVILGGVFQLFQFTYGKPVCQTRPISQLCHVASPRFLRHFLAVDFAVEEINKNLNILPNISLGYDIFDSCFYEVTAVEGALQILSGGTTLYPNYDCRKNNKVVAFIGHLLSSSSQVIANLLNIYGYSQVSYGATDPIFRDRMRFPFLFRTVPNKQVKNRVLVKLLKHYGWTWVGIVYSADDSNQKAAEELIPLILKSDGCVAFTVKIYQEDSEAFEEALRVIQNSSANIIIVFSPLEHLLLMVGHLQRHDLLFGKVWILPNFPIVEHLALKKYLIVFNGSLIISPYRGDIPNFKEFLYNANPYKYPNRLMRLLWYYTFNCEIQTPDNKYLPSQLCKGNFSLRTVPVWKYDVDNFRLTYSVYIAVYALAHALHSMNLYHLQKKAAPVFHYPGKLDSREEHQEHVRQVLQVLHPFEVLQIQFLGHTVCANGFQMDPVKSSVPEVERYSSCLIKVWREVEKDSLITCDRNKTTWNCKCRRASAFKLAHFLRHVSFETNSGDKIYFNEHGETPGRLEIQNWLIFPNEATESVNVGRYLSEQLSLNDSSIQWPSNSSTIPRSVCTVSCPSGFRKSGREGKPICCYNCVPCSAGEISNTTDMDGCITCHEDEWPNIQKDECVPKIVTFLSFSDPIGITLTTSSAVCFTISVAALGIFTVYRDTPIVKASNRDLSYILLLSLMISFLCTLMFIGRPSALSCISRQVTFCIVFTVSVSSTLAKNIAVFMAFKSTRPESKLWPKFLFPKFIILLCCLNQVTICSVWLSRWPPFPELDRHTELGKIILQCNEGSSLAFYMALGYIGLLAFFSFVLAFCIRKLPDRYNEAHHITFSMLVFSAVWITFIPVYLTTKGKYLVAVEMFAILTSSFGLLVCIFFPKCYTIILKPERNIRNKIHVRSGKTTESADSPEEVMDTSKHVVN